MVNCVRQTVCGLWARHLLSLSEILLERVAEYFGVLDKLALSDIQRLLDVFEGNRLDSEAVSYGRLGQAGLTYLAIG